MHHGSPETATETARAEKRAPILETRVTEPAAKARRLETAANRVTNADGIMMTSGDLVPPSGSSMSALIAQLKNTVAALKAASPGSFDCGQLFALQESHSSLGKVVKNVEAQKEAELNPPPEETPLPLDMLVSTLAFLPTKDLAIAACTSRHFAKAFPMAVKHRLDHFTGRYSQFVLDSGDSICIELLLRVEQEWAQMGKLLPNLFYRKEKVYYLQSVDLLHDMINQMVFMHGMVIEKFSPFLWLLVRRVLNASRRADLLDILQAHAGLTNPKRILQAVLPDVENATEASMQALCHMMEMPVAVIEAHMSKLVWWVTSNDKCKGGAWAAATVLLKLPPDVLRRAGVEAEIKASSWTKSADSEVRDALAKLLARIREGR